MWSSAPIQSTPVKRIKPDRQGNNPQMPFDMKFSFFKLRGKSPIDRAITLILVALFITSVVVKRRKPNRQGNNSCTPPLSRSPALQLREESPIDREIT